jgi:peptide/nickel transport system substrate-binding protein
VTALAAHITGSRQARRPAVLLATACLAAVAALAPACADDNSVLSGREDNGRITVAIPGDDDAVEPLRFILTQTRLIRLDQSGLEQPALIERWTQSADRRTWTLLVRDGVRLHDGRVAMAADVVSRVKDAFEPAPHRPGLWRVDSVEEAGPREVRLRLREPSSLLLEALSVLQAVPAGPFSGPDDAVLDPEFSAVSQPGQPTGQVKAVKVRRYDTARAAVAALLRDDVDVLYEVPPESRALLIGEEGVRVFPNVKPYVVTLGFNHKHPVLRKRDVRLAMNIAIDRRVLVAQVAGGVGVPATDMIWHQH